MELDELELLVDVETTAPETFNTSPGWIRVEDKLFKLIIFETVVLYFAAIALSVSPDFTVYVFVDEEDVELAETLPLDLDTVNTWFG